MSPSSDAFGNAQECAMEPEMQNATGIQRQLLSKDFPIGNLGNGYVGEEKQNG